MEKLNEMIFRRILIGSLLISMSFTCISQTDSLISWSRISSGIRLAYNSSIIYPGIRLGIDFPVYIVNVLKTNDTMTAISAVKERFVSADAGWYHHPDFHDNICFTAEWTMRRINNKGFFTEFSAGPGYSRTFLGGTTYRVDNSGEVTVIRFAGYNYAMLIAGVGLGFDFSKLKREPFSVYSKFNMLMMFPYNSTIYFRPAIEFGLIFRPERFIQILTKKKIVKK
jgi:hypothetical protein